MTMPRNLESSCSAGSQAPELASSPRDYAWNVNFNNGNVDYNNQNNNAFVRAVRSVRAGEYQGAAEKVSLHELYRAWKAARRKKVPSENQMGFEAFWGDGLLRLQDRINRCTWSPGPTTCFVAKRPKAREIHAPDFADRVVHHWLVPKLDALFEPRFIFDSFANRPGKGTHAAVRRLKDFVHQVASGQGGGWYLQLDIRNFFNSIHRPTLYRILKQRLVESGASQIVQRATHALLRQSVELQGVIHRATPAERALVPHHKRLENAAPGYGIPIGNLSSQFFANVYLDRLDHFVKHGLRAKRYLRYVDDFVLVHRDRAQLEIWQHQITEYLRRELRLELKADIKLRPLSAGIDFLGYVVYPTHVRVRRRVVRHAFAAIGASRQRTREEREHQRSVLASYIGHFAHANARRLTAKLEAAACK
jgi:RNA-directed DNA polymerase